MKSGSNTSCFGAAILLIGIVFLLKILFPSFWGFITGFMVKAFFAGFFLIILGLCAVGYLILKNLTKNREVQQAKKYERVTRVEGMYRSVVDRLNRDMVLNQVSA